MDIRVRPGRRVVNGWREYEVVSNGGDPVWTSVHVGDGATIASGMVSMRPSWRPLTGRERQAVIDCACDFDITPIPL